MATPEQIKEALRKVVGAKPNLPIKGKVTAVNGDTCSVMVAGDLELSGVRLRATVNEDDDFMKVTPVIGSGVVLLSLTGNLDNLTVIKVDKVSRVELKQSQLHVLVDTVDGKVQIKNGSASLFQMLNDLNAALKQLTVSTPAGPSGVPLSPTQLALNTFETRLNAILK